MWNYACWSGMCSWISWCFRRYSLLVDATMWWGLLDLEGIIYSWRTGCIISISKTFTSWELKIILITLSKIWEFFGMRASTPPIGNQLKKYATYGKTRHRTNVTKNYGEIVFVLFNITKIYTGISLETFLLLMKNIHALWSECFIYIV